MKQFVEFIPVALFVGVYFYTRDIYLSTGVLMAGIVFQVGYEFVRTGKVARQTQVIFWVAMLFGGATLLLRDETFIQWKPTVVNWFFALALLGSQFVGDKNLLHRLLGSQIPLPLIVWRNLNFGWSLGFFIAGSLNLYVAYNFSLEFWVSFKLIGGFLTTLTYMAISIGYLASAGYLNEEAMGKMGETKDKPDNKLVAEPAVPSKEDA